MRKTPADADIATWATRTPKRLFVSFTNLALIIIKKAEVPPSTTARKPKISPIEVGARTVSLHRWSSFLLSYDPVHDMVVVMVVVRLV